MDILTFKTAIRLKEAGFPQPEFAPGQFWYDQNGLSFVIRNNDRILTSVWFDKPMEASLNLIRLNVYFAPNATDILRHFGDATLFYDCRKDKFICGAGSNDVGIAWTNTDHENPAEAAAIPFLEINEKQPV